MSHFQQDNASRRSQAINKINKWPDQNQFQLIDSGSVGKEIMPFYQRNTDSRHTAVVGFLSAIVIQIAANQFSAAQPSSTKSTQELAQPAAVVSGYESIEQRLTEFVERELKDKDIPAISIAVVDGDKTVLAKGFGVASADGKQRVSANSIYRVGSVSKLFTDLCVMQLSHQGKLDLDANIQKYLPDFSPKNQFGVPITLRMLMSHQSGLVRESPIGSYFDDTSPSLAATVASLNSTNLVYKPGTRTKYSNAGVSVAGVVVERLSGQPFEEYVHNVLLEPLEMSESGFRFNESMKRNLATGWMRSHHAPRSIAPNFALGTLPAGNLYASMNELSHFLIALLNAGKFHGKRVIDPEVLDAMLKPSIASDDKVHDYGIGFRLGTIDGRRTFGHGGAVYGYSTQLVGLPAEKIGVVASASLDGANGVTKRLTDYAVRLLLAQKAGQPLPDIEKTKPIPANVVAKLLGTYTSAEKFVSVVDQGGIIFVFDGAYLKRLRAIADGYVIDDLTGFGPKVTLAESGSIMMKDREWKKIEAARPAPMPSRFDALVGEYGWDHNVLYIFEDRGQLWALIEWFDFCPLTEISPDVFAFPEEGGLYHGEQIIFATDDGRPAPYATVASVRFNRRPVGIEGDKPFQIKPLEPVEELYRIAREATPPKEYNRPRSFELVELTSLDPTIKLDIRYATKNNFMGTPFYKQARAFLQRPAAEALVRVHKKLNDKGYGLWIYDGYRPWYVTKMFWEGTTPAQHSFVADPSQGSKHNRGCAVDLSLYDLKSGKPVSMVSGYDEMSPRSYPHYPGGTSEQRWHRNTLREAIQREGFTVYPTEWWHFDYKDWEQYPIGNVTFDDIAAQKN